MSWPQSKARLWEKAPMIRLLLPFVAGIWCYDQVWDKVPGPQYLYMALFATSIVAVSLLLRPAKNNGSKWLQWLSTQFCMLLLGFVLCSYHATTPLPETGIAAGRRTLVALVSEPQVKEHSTRLKVQVLASGDSVPMQYQTGLALVYLSGNDSCPVLHQGDTLLLPDHWQPIRNSGNPFSFDYAAYCRHNGIAARQMVHAGQLIRTGSTPVKSWLQKAHHYCTARLEQHIKDRQALALLKAMLTGDESEMDPALRQAYADTGIIHVISISGSHVNLVFTMIVFLLGWLRNRRHRWIQYLLAFAFIWAYVIMAGASAPAIRAALMFSIAAAGTLLNRESSPLNQLCVAAFLMLLIQPFWLFAVGFQLSFLAILSLTLFYEPIVSCWSSHAPVLRFLWRMIAASLAAELLIAPLCAYYFHNFPPMFLVANIIAGLTMSVVLIAGVLLILLGFIPLLAEWIGRFTEWIIVVFHKVVYSLQSCSPETFRRLQLDFMSLLCLYLVIAGFTWFLLRRNKPGLYIGICALLMGTVQYCFVSWQSARQKVFIVYNSYGSCQAELISGHCYQSFTGDSLENYDSRMAHIGFHCNQKNLDSCSAFTVGRQRVCVYNAVAHASTQHHFSTDVLVLKGKIDTPFIEEIGRTFTAQVWVLANDQPRKYMAAWHRYTESRNIRLHYTPDMGAFVLPQ